MAGPEWVIKAIGKTQSQTTSNPASISQKAAIAALTGSQSKTKEMVAEFQKRRDYIHQRLEDMPGVSCLLPKGAFYCFPNCSGLLGNRCPNPKDLTEYLLRHARVAVVAGEGFGSNLHLRISYSTGIELIKTAMDRIDAVLKDL